MSANKALRQLSLWGQRGQCSGLASRAYRGCFKLHKLSSLPRPLVRQNSSVARQLDSRHERKAGPSDQSLFIESRQHITPYVPNADAEIRETEGPFCDEKGIFFTDASTKTRSSVSNWWLRDQCACHECVHPETKQRQLESFKIDPAIKVQRFSYDPTKSQSVRIQWSDGHESTYTPGMLQKQKPKTYDFRKRGLVERHLFGSGIAATPPTVEYESIMHGDGVKEWTKQISVYGFSFVRGCPIDPDATEKLLKVIGPIRETHYGGFYDFTSNMASKDTAYTTLSLGGHTDTTYFSDPAGLQMFHMLSHTGGSGGESLLVDGFAAAEQLYREDAEAYRILSTVRVWAHASGNEDVSIMPYTCLPVLTHDPVLGHLVMVRWNNDDRAGIEAEGDMVDKWYQAAAKFNRILNDEKNQYWTQLQPGVPLIFDNWRVLHGRSAFSGKRRMCGGYINRDDFVSKFKLSNTSRDEVLEATVTG